MRVNEIRKAVYHSELIDVVDKFVKFQLDSDGGIYRKLFSDAKIKRFEDYGIFYKAIAFYVSINEEKLIVEKYNSRPRELINNVLASFQKKSNNPFTRDISEVPIDDILNKTLEILEYFKETESEQYYLECCIKIAVDSPERYNKIKKLIKEDDEIKETFIKSKATTSQVNTRIERVYSIFNEN